MLDTLSSASAERTAYERNAEAAAKESADIAVAEQQALEQQRRQYALFSGEQIAKAGASGSYASSFDVIADSASQNELDLLTIRRNAASHRNSVRTSQAAERAKISSLGMRTGTKILGKIASGVGRTSYASD